MTIELMSSDSDDFNITSRIYNCSPVDDDEPCSPEEVECPPDMCGCTPDSSDEDW